MSNGLFYGIVASLVIFLFVPGSYAQSHDGDVYWHTDSDYGTCSMVVDSSLTQAQWHRFTKQAGAIISFKSLSSAKTLGKMKFNIAIDNGYTPIDQHDLAWINTFSHPDEECPLGDAITFPAIRASFGVANNMDVGGYWTTAPGANYGMVGGEFKYAFLQETAKYPAAAVRASISVLTGVPDFNFYVYSVDLMASKKFAKLTPYIGLKESLAIGVETTSKVDLRRESVSVTQGYAGAAYSIWLLNLVAEYNVSTVNTFAFAVGFNL